MANCQQLSNTYLLDAWQLSAFVEHFFLDGFMKNYYQFLSLFKLFFWQYIFHSLNQRLLRGFASSQSVKANGVGIKLHLRPHQPMQPIFIHPKITAQQMNTARGRCATEENNSPARRLLKVQLPLAGKCSTGGRSFYPRRTALAMGRDVSGGALLKLCKRTVDEAGPHLGLPQAVEIFDRRLKPWFSGRGEYWRNVQAGTATG